MTVAPDKLATWANAITVGRLLLSPLMFWVIPNDDLGSWIAFVMWALFSSTDFLDGYLARRQGTTSAGAFLDPLADKVLILGAMFTLVSTGMFWVVPVVIITAREVIISVYRVLVGGKGISVPAIKLAKYKTVCQQLAVAFALMPLTAVDATWLWNSFLWIAVVLALVSGWQYLWRARQMEAAGDFGALAADGARGRRAGRPGGSGRMTLRCDVLAVGTELLLGQIIDSNSAWIGGELAANGIDSLVQVKVGDNVGRIEKQLRRLLDDADAVIMCGGLGPTHDDLTRDAIAAVMGVELVTDEAIGEVIREMFAARGRRMPENNLRQAQVPVGASIIPQTRGTAPGLDLSREDRRRRQGRLRRPGRAPRDVRHGAPGDPARPPPPERRRLGDRQQGAAHVGRERERTQRATRRRDRATRGPRHPDAGVPGEWLGGSEGPLDPQGADRRRMCHATRPLGAGGPCGAG